MSTVPEAIIRACLRIGIEAIKGDLTVLDDIWSDLAPDDLESFKNAWEQEPPTVIQGYASSKSPFPCWAIVLLAEEENQQYLAIGEQAMLAGSPPVKSGTTYRKRLQGNFGIHCYVGHADMCAAHYRVARRILNVGSFFLIKNKLDNPKLSGQDLSPEVQYNLPENLFVRLLVLTVEYEECWSDSDALAAALMAPQVEWVAEPKIHAFHEDRTVDGIDGGIHPVEE